MIAGWLIRVANTKNLDELGVVRDDMNDAAALFSDAEKAKLRSAVASRVNVFTADVQLNAKPQNVTCPICGGPMKSRMSRHGAFWGCQNYPRCKGTRNVDGQSKQERFGADQDEAR